MALKKSQLYSSLWQSCDELRGGMDASQYKDYVLVLRDGGTKPERSRLTASSRDEAVLALHEGGASDPTLTGATLEVVTHPGGEANARSPRERHGREVIISSGILTLGTGSSGPLIQEFPLPASNWKRKGSTYRYKDKKGELGPVRQVRLRDGRKLSLKVQGSGLDVDLLEEPGALDIVLRTGNASHCLWFGGDRKFEPEKSLRAKRAEAPERCPPP